jgi:hypothetical protein
MVGEQCSPPFHRFFQPQLLGADPEPPFQSNKGWLRTCYAAARTTLEASAAAESYGRW